MKYDEDSLYLEVVKDKSWLVDLRRAFHQNPELSEKEYQTQALCLYMANQLK